MNTSNSTLLALCLPGVVSLIVGFAGGIVFDDTANPSQRVTRYFNVFAALIWLVAVIASVLIISGRGPGVLSYVGFAVGWILSSVGALLFGIVLGLTVSSVGEGL